MMGMKKRSSFALVDADVSGARVYPALLRKPMRFLGRLGQGEVDVPRFAGVMGAAAFLALTGIYGVVLGGHSPAVLKATTSQMGFAIGEVKISGHKETSEIDLLEQLELDGATSLIGFDSDAARERVLRMPWVAAAEVTKLYPDGISVRVTEKRPYAVWQDGETLTLIEEDGKGIVPFSDEKYLALPLLTGVGASQKAREIVSILADFPGFASRVKAYVHIGGRRWDLQLDDGVIIHLPERDLETALAEVVRLEKEQALLGRDIQSVDLRISDRMVVRLSDEAMALRAAAIKDYDAKKKKAGSHI